MTESALLPERRTNCVENLLAGLPGEIQSVLRPLLDPFTQALEWVAGDPRALRAAAEVWRGCGADVAAESQQCARDVHAALAEWNGPAAEAFAARMAQVGQSLDGIAANLSGTSGLLEEVANGCVRTFDLIVDILIDLVVMLAADLLVSLGLSLVTFGASLAAGAVKAAADAAIAFARVGRLVRKLAELLTRVAGLLERLREALVSYHEGLRLLRALKSATSPLSRQGMVVRTGLSVYTLPARVAIGDVIGEPIPAGYLGGVVNVGKDIYQYQRER